MTEHGDPRAVETTPEVAPEVRAGYAMAQRVNAIVADLLETDALTGNDEGTPSHYTVHADDLDYLVRTILALDPSSPDRPNGDAPAGASASVDDQVDDEPGHDTVVETDELTQVLTDGERNAVLMSEGGLDWPEDTFAVLDKIAYARMVKCFDAGFDLATDRPLISVRDFKVERTLMFQRISDLSLPQSGRSLRSGV